jgi:hypothetical protein
MLMSQLGWLLVLLAQDAGARPTAGPSRPSLLPTPTVVQEPRYRLRPTRDGGYEYEDTRFKAVVAPDGRVSFDDRRVSSKWQLIPVFPQNHPPGTPTLESTLRDLLRRRKSPPPPPAPPPIPERPPASGPLTERDRRRMEEYYKVVPVVAVTGTADLTDEYYRMLGEDPYRYEKARFLSSTFEMRLKMAAESQLHDLRRSLHELRSRLDRLWSDPSHPPTARRLIVCALFGELSRDETGRVATEVINNFVRTRLPQGSADGYTAAELEACNAGAGGRERFDPYRPNPKKPTAKPSPKNR